MSPLAAITSKLNDIRHMQYIISTPAFIHKYDQTDCKKQIDFIIAGCNREAFDKWMRADRCLEEHTISELKAIASQKRIVNYSRMDKQRLIKEIKACG